VFGINTNEFLVLLIVAAIVLGPERLPEYAAQFARLIRQLKAMAQGASAQVKSELGEDFQDVDWAKLDPRQYDPRRIVREALSGSVDFEDPLGLKGERLNGAGANGPRERKTAVQPNTETSSAPAFDPDAT
jgi:sec-independent protein translocase protein TatB